MYRRRSRSLPWYRLWPVALLLLPYAAAGAPAAAQSDDAVAAPAVTAAFIYNVVKFAEWPAEAAKPGTALRLCTNDRAVANGLTQLGGDGSGVRPVEIVQVSADSLRVQSCQLLYITGIGEAAVRQAVESVQGLPVLTIGDGDRFAAAGGVIEVAVKDRHMRFSVNMDAMTRQRVQLSSRLLALATIVKETRGQGARGPQH